MGSRRQAGSEPTLSPVLLVDLAEHLKFGFAMHQRPTHGLSAIASGVFTPSDELAAVMSICALSSRMQSDRLPTLVDCLRRHCAAAGACDFDA